MYTIENLRKLMDEQIIVDYFADKIAKNDYPPIVNELKQLQNVIDDFNSGLVNGDPAYYAFLLQQSQLIKNFNQEAEFLEWVIPLWSQERGKIFAADKAVDEFYRELELLTLWRLLLKAIQNDEFLSAEVRQMRRIIRRYGKMPLLWRYLCNLSGEDITTAYTF